MRIGQQVPIVLEERIAHVQVGDAIRIGVLPSRPCVEQSEQTAHTPAGSPDGSVSFIACNILNGGHLAVRQDVTPYALPKSLTPFAQSAVPKFDPSREAA